MARRLLVVTRSSFQCELRIHPAAGPEIRIDWQLQLEVSVDEGAHRLLLLGWGG